MIHIWLLHYTSSDIKFKLNIEFLFIFRITQYHTYKKIIYIQHNNRNKIMFTFI
jgi:hypothetical protein